MNLPAPARSVVEHPWTWLVGALFGFLALGGAWPVWSDWLLDVRDQRYPVITDWAVTHAVVEGEDVVLRGTMRKRRECLLVPPVIARDVGGVPYTLSAEWRAKDSSAETIPWGPWRIVAGAGRALSFTMVYICAGNRPNIVAVGSYIPQGEAAASGAKP